MGNLAMPRPLEVSAHPNPNANPTPTPTPTSTPNPNPNPTPNLLEVSAALNRLRSLQIGQSARRPFEKL